MSVVMMGIRSTVVPSARSGLNVFAKWLGVASTVIVCAVARDAVIERHNGIRNGVHATLCKIAAQFRVERVFLRDNLFPRYQYLSTDWCVHADTNVATKNCERSLRQLVERICVAVPSGFQRRAIR